MGNLRKKPLKRVKAGTSKQSAADKKRLFVEAYLSNGGNATQAAIAAGYSEKSARRQGSRLTTDAHILTELDKRRTETLGKFQITTERIQQERARLAFFDVRKLVDKEGKPIPIQELDDDTAAAIAGLELVEEYAGSGEDRVFVGYTKKFKLADKNASLTALERQLGMYGKDNEQPAQAATKALTDFMQAIYGDRNKLPIAHD